MIAAFFCVLYPMKSARASRSQKTIIRGEANYLTKLQFFSELIKKDLTNSFGSTI